MEKHRFSHRMVKNLSNKSTRSFITFEIVDFYPSISEELLHEALAFASNHTTITENKKAIIIQAKNERNQFYSAETRHGLTKRLSLFFMKRWAALMAPKLVN